MTSPRQTAAAALATSDVPLQQVGVVVVDHGSRRAESNAMLEEAARRYAEVSPYGIVEPAHMELAAPTIAQAFARCVERGAKLIVVFPYFLAPGRHWSKDIPALAKEAAETFPEVPYLVAAPFGLHPGMLTIIDDRIGQCLTRSLNDGRACDICEDGGGCQMLRTGKD